MERKAFLGGEVHHDHGSTFFIDAPGGTGKTFLLNLLLTKVRLTNNIALAVASSGIAATLLDGGRTAHSMFSLPLDLTRQEKPLCNIKKDSAKAKLLQNCKLIIWDEATMSHKKAMEAVDSTLQDLKDNTQIMGGVTLVFAGDFRQTLPIVPRGTRADQMNACLKNSYLWHHIKTMSLTLNMRVHLHADDAVGDFAIKLLQVGNGLLDKDSYNQIQLPFTTIQTEEEFIMRVFPDLHNLHTDINWLSSRAILAAKNESVNEINSRLLNRLPGEIILYNSVDTICSQDEVTNYPTEFLNSLEPPGTPPHSLFLKLGAPIMLLRNLDPPKLCNGTRLTIKNMMPHVLEATIMSGKYAGLHCFIPRIPMRPQELPFEFERLQFPVKLSFAMTINKSQGQSLKVVGLNLSKPVFSHGQLYVGLSRVGHPDGLFILAPDKKTKNIVYSEALR